MLRQISPLVATHLANKMRTLSYESLQSTHLIACRVPGSVHVSWTLEVAVLDVISGVARKNIRWELNFEEFVILMPVNLKLKI